MSTEKHDDLKNLLGHKNLTKNLQGIKFTEKYDVEVGGELHQIVFFTKTKMNLDYANLKNNRHMATLLVKEPNSIERYTRLMLDPKLYWDAHDIIGGKVVPVKLQSDLVNPYNPFIPIMTNTLESLSGYPTVAVETYSSKEGARKEQWGYVDSPYRIYNKFNLTATFKNDVAFLNKSIIDTWVTYSSLVREDIMRPRLSELIGRRIDYQTAIYNIVLASDKRTILHWSRTIGFPVAAPKDEIFNYTKEPKHAGDYTTMFECFGVEYSDPITLKEFNDVVGTFNPHLRDYGNGISNDMVELPDEMLKEFEHLAVPYIDLRYNTLEWLVRKEDVEKLEIKIPKGNKSWL